MGSLRNKRVILGVSGGIAAYKSAELCRELVRAGAEVQVVMTASAQHFITPLTLQALSGSRVRTTLLDQEAEAAMGHIELARWADLVLVAPATADCLARLTHGQARDLLDTLCLATRAPVALAPAMNQAMWEKPQTRRNIARLREDGVTLLGPGEGDQACGETGPGRMLEPEVIAGQAADLFDTGELDGRKVTITAGPTREALDPVRFISNHSSGKMGYAVAQAAADAGADVTLVSGPVDLSPPPEVRVVNVTSAAEMLEACRGRETDIFIGVAAVADYRPVHTAGQKIKKGQETMSLELMKTPDILAVMAGDDPRPFCVGFAAETEHHREHARQKLTAKGADLILANDALATFGSDDVALTAYWADGETALPPGGKNQAARALIRLINERMQRE